MRQLTEQQNEIGNILQLKYYSGNTIDISDLPSWLPKASFSKTQTDLLIKSPDGDEILLIDYFTNYELPSLKTENGLLFKGSVIDILSGSFSPGKFVQASGEDALSIGEVSSVTGSAKATRIDGTLSKDITLRR